MIRGENAEIERPRNGCNLGKPTMVNEHVLVPPKAATPELAGVDSRILLARQIRLYIETAPVFHLLAVGIGMGGAAGLIWLYAPEQHSTTLTWAFAIAAILLVRLAAWIAYSRTRPGDDAVRGWLKWFVVPHACSMAAIGAAPLLLVPSASGHEAEILLTITMLVYVVAVGSAQKFSAYRPVVPILLGPMVLVYVASMLWFPGIAPKVLAFGGVVAGLWSYRMAASFNRSIVQSMELSIRNENLVIALEARGARRAAARADRGRRGRATGGRGCRARKDPFSRGREPRPATAPACLESVRRAIAHRDRSGRAQPGDRAD